MKALFVSIALLLGIGTTQAAPLLYDMGTEKSRVWEGFTPVTTQSVYTETAGYGWQTAEGLKALVRAYTEPVENQGRGTTEHPPIWTNPITEDTHVGDRENAFLVKATPGEVEVYVVCGSSERTRGQYYDFTVSVGGQEQRVQIEAGQYFRSLRFRAKATAEPLAIRFSPRSKFLVNAIMVWSPADSARVEKEIIKPFEEWTYRLPPEEWAKWQELPGPEPGPMPPVSAADEKRGFLVWSRHYLECIFPNTRPRPEELNPELRLFATPGEYEPATFTVHPLRDLSDAKVTVTALGPIPAARVDVRRVRYMLARPNYRVTYHYQVVPDILERFDRLDLKAGENARFWLTVHVPENTPAGTYTGKAIFECSGGKAEVPIRISVLPFQLQEDETKIYGIYYRHPYDEMARATDDVSREYYRRKADLEHRDMVAHGTRNVVLSVPSTAADAEGNFKVDWDLMAAKIELWRKHGFRGPIVTSISCGAVYYKYMKESPGSHLHAVKDPPPEFARELTALVKYIEGERRKRGWPEFLYYPIDEPGTHPASVRFMVTVLKACKEAGVRTYVTADPTHEQFAPMRPYVDVWCTQPFAPDRQTILADMKARNVEYWCYPNHVNGENNHTPVAGARMTYGFGFWRSGFRTLIPWIYSSSTGDPFNYLDGPSMDFFNRSEPDGTPIPVAMWEAYREGYDDYRYIYTLRQLIAQAKRSPRPAAKKAAAEAEKELQFVWDSIRVQAKYKHDDLWTPTEFDVNRWLIAQQILAVRQALK